MRKLSTILAAATLAATGFSTQLVATPGTHADTLASTVSTGPKTLLWLNGLNPSNMLNEIPLMQRMHAGGFLFDNTYNGTHDDFLNGGVARMGQTALSSYATQVQQIITKAKAAGLTDIYQRVLADVLIRSNPAGSQYKFDIFNQTEINALKTTFTYEAQWAKAIGMKGIWIDAEPYDYNLYRRQNQDPSLPASSKTEDQVKAQYFLLGQTAEQAMLAVYPQIQVILSPAFGYEGSGPTSAYQYYPDFYAGMVSAASQTPGANGFVLATEASYGQGASAFFQGIYTYEEGTKPIGIHNGVAIYTNALNSLQTYDAAHGTHLWAWHLAHSTVALSTWPYKTDGTYRFSLTDWQHILVQERSVSPQYTWIYDENGQWFKSSYTCSWNNQTITSSMPCPGLVLHDTLPALPGQS